MIVIKIHYMYDLIDSSDSFSKLYFDKLSNNVKEKDEKLTVNNELNLGRKKNIVNKTNPEELGYNNKIDSNLQSINENRLKFVKKLGYPSNLVTTIQGMNLGNYRECGERWRAHEKRP